MARHICLISGKDSLAATVVQKRLDPDLPYEYVFNPTGWDLPDTVLWLTKVERYLGQKILRIGGDLNSICKEAGMLPSINSRFCTRKAKIEPLKQFLRGDMAHVYYGLRADEP